MVRTCTPQLDVAAAKVLRQLRKYKTRIIDKKIADAPAKAGTKLDIDGPDAGAFR